MPQQLTLLSTGKTLSKAAIRSAQKRAAKPAISKKARTEVLRCKLLKSPVVRFTEELPDFGEYDFFTYCREEILDSFGKILKVMLPDDFSFEEGWPEAPPKEIAVDIETTSLDPLLGTVEILCGYVPESSTLYYVVDKEQIQSAVDVTHSWVQEGKTLFGAFNVGFESIWLQTHSTTNFPLWNPSLSRFYDPQVIFQVCAQGLLMKHNLGNYAQMFFKLDLGDDKKGVKHQDFTKKSFWQVFYCCRDALLVWALKEVMMARASTKDKTLEAIALREAALPSFLNLSYTGAHIDQEVAKANLAVVKPEFDTRVLAFEQQWGFPYDLHSSKLAPVLSNKLGMEITSTSKKEIGTLSHLPLVKELLTLRNLKNYLDHSQRFVDNETLVTSLFTTGGYNFGRAKSSLLFDRGFNIHGVVSKNPAFPGINLRDAVKPREGYVFVGADLNTAHVRIAAHYSNCRVLLDAINEDRDTGSSAAVGIVLLLLRELQNLGCKRANDLLEGHEVIDWRWIEKHRKEEGTLEGKLADSCRAAAKILIYGSFNGSGVTTAHKAFAPMFSKVCDMWLKDNKEYMESIPDEDIEDLYSYLYEETKPVVESLEWSKDQSEAVVKEFKALVGDLLDHLRGMRSEYQRPESAYRIPYGLSGVQFPLYRSTYLEDVGQTVFLPWRPQKYEKGENVDYSAPSPAFLLTHEAYIVYKWFSLLIPYLSHGLATLVLHVHDELVFEVREDYALEFGRLMIDCLEKVMGEFLPSISPAVPAKVTPDKLISYKWEK